jgi:hypothetical protein
MSVMCVRGRSFEPLAHQIYFLQHRSFTLFDVLDAFRSSAGVHVMISCQLPQPATHSLLTPTYRNRSQRAVLGVP